MADNVVNFKLMGDSSSFKRAMSEAAESSKNFQRGLSDIGVRAQQFFGVGAIIAGFKAVVESAQEARDAAEAIGAKVDASTASVARLGDAFDAFKKSAMQGATAFLGLYARAGELIGTTIAELKEGLSLDQVERIQGVYDSIAENEKRLAEGRAANAPEKVAEAEKKLAETRREELIKRLDGEQKVSALLVEQNRLRGELAELGKNTVAYQEKAQELEKNITETQLAARDMQKAKLEELKKATEERQNKEKEYSKEQYAAQERLAKARFEALAPEQQVEELLRQQAALQHQITESKKLGLSVLDDEADLQENRNKLAALERSIAEDRLKLERQTTGEVEKQAEVITGIGGIRGQKQFAEASDEALREVIRRNRQGAVDIQNLPRFGADRVWNQGEVARMNFEADNAQAELDFRRSLRFQVASMGQDFARQQYRGDPLNFDSVIQKYVTDSRDVLAANKEAVDVLRSLDSRLAPILPKR